MTRHEFNIFKQVLAEGANAEVAAKEAKRRRRLDSTGRARGVVRAEDQVPGLLKPLVEEAESISAAKERAKEEAAIEEEQRAREEEVRMEARRTTKYREKMEGIMASASTDLELWEVFNTRMRKSVDAVLEGKKDGENVNLTTLTTTLPQLLLHMSGLLRRNFPGSGYALALLPSLRRIGPNVFTMGATTELFNTHMRILFESYSDLDAIAELLGEMERDVYEFNKGTHALLEDIFQRAEDAARGKLGSAVRALWGTEGKIRGLEKLEEWETIVAERIGKAEAKKAEWKRARVDGEEEEEHELMKS